jgi:hypothetical protein
VNDFQFENLIKAVEICFKQNFCAMYFEDLVRKFYPEISEEAVKEAVLTMHERGQLIPDDDILRLVIR